MSVLRYKVINYLDAHNVPCKHPKHMKYYGKMVIWDFENSLVVYDMNYNVDSVEFLIDTCNDLHRKHEERISYLNEVSNYAKR